MQLELYGTISSSVLSLQNNASGMETFSVAVKSEFYTTGNTASSDELDTDPNYPDNGGSDLHSSRQITLSSPGAATALLLLIARSALLPIRVQR